MSFPIPGLIKSLFSTFPLYVYPSSPSPAASEGSKGGGARTLLAVDNDRRSLAAEVFLLGRSIAFDIIHVDADGGNVFYDDGQEIPLDGLAQKYGSLDDDDDDDDDENAETARLREAVRSVLSSVQSGLVGREREIACLNKLTDVMDDRLRAEVYALVHLATTPHSPPSAAAAATERAILKRHGGRLIALHDRLHAALPLTASTKRVYKEEES